MRKPKRTPPDCEFSDREVDQIDLVAREEFVPESEWNVEDVRRRPSRRDMDIRIRHFVGDAKQLTIEVPCQQFAHENAANQSDLTDAVFNFSICLLEFSGIRGFDEFEDGETVSLVVYPNR